MLAADAHRVGLVRRQRAGGGGGGLALREGVDGLQAAVVGARVDGLDSGGEGGEVRGEFLRLVEAVGGEGGIGGDARGRGDVGAVVALVVDGPCGAKLLSLALSFNGLVSFVMSVACVTSCVHGSVGRCIKRMVVSLPHAEQCKSFPTTLLLCL